MNQYSVTNGRGEGATREHARAAAAGEVQKTLPYLRDPSILERSWLGLTP